MKINITLCLILASIISNIVYSQCDPNCFTCDSVSNTCTLCETGYLYLNSCI